MKCSNLLFVSFFSFFFFPCAKSIENNFAGVWFISDTNLINDSLFANVNCESFDKDIEPYPLGQTTMPNGVYTLSSPSVDGCQFVPVAICKTWENKKAIAALFAFPFPFGMLGLHRIYLGTKPYIPFAYISTLGGCFGILPLIDFISILTAEDETFNRFENNPKVFMWSH